MLQRESPQVHLTTWEILVASRDWNVYIQRDYETHKDDDIVLPFNDELISLEKFHINTRKSLVYVEQKVDKPTSCHSNDCSVHITNLT